MKRFRDILKNNTPLWSRIQILIDDTQNIWLRELGKNDFIHAQNVEKILDKLVPDEVKTNKDFFDYGDIFILLASVYLHDIGRRKASLHHELESYNQIRKYHSMFYLQNHFVGEAVAQVCAAHAEEAEWPIAKCDNSYGIFELNDSGRPLDLRRLGALLRISDELENTYTRVNGVINQVSSVRHLIRDINPIHSKGIIEIQSEPNTWEDWAQLKAVRDYTDKRVKEVTEYLKQSGLSYYQVWLGPKSFSAPLSIFENNTSYQDLVECIATLAESTGANVEIFSKIEGCEISVIATENKLGFTTKAAFMIAQSLDKAKAHEIGEALICLREKGYFHHVMIVTNNIPGAVVVDYLNCKNIKSATLTDLIRETYNFEKSVNIYIKQYEANEIYVKNIYIKSSASHENGENIGDIEEYLNNWKLSAEGVQTTILGDYGIGKTTLCKTFAYKAAKAYIDDPENNRIPIFLELKELGIFNSIESAITSYIINKFNISITYKAFELLNKRGCFLLILDGFDELSNIANEDSAIHAFREIDKLVEQNSKIILSCRTHFFKDNVEIHKLHKGTSLYNAIDHKYGYNLIFINPFNEQQVNEYLDRWFENRGKEFKSIIQKFYNLSDLSTRPVLLNMIVKTLPQISSGNISSLNSCGIYELYVGFWYGRDDWRSVLSISERRDLTKALSDYMYSNRLYELHYLVLPKAFPFFKNVITNHNSEILDHELRTCNFLKRDYKGNYSFVHKSFFEFFLAISLSDELFYNETDVNRKWFLPCECLAPHQNQMIASTEIQTFFFESFSSSLQKDNISWANLLLRVQERKRALNLAILSLIEINRGDFGNFFVRLLFNHHCQVSSTQIVEQIILSDDPAGSLLYLEELLLNTMDIDLLLKINDTICKTVPIKYKFYIDKIKDIINERINVSQTSEKLLDSNSYPYSRENKQIKLDLFLQGLTDIEDLSRAKKTFLRHWEREKSNYESKLRKHERLSKKDIEDTYIDFDSKPGKPDRSG